MRCSKATSTIHTVRIEINTISKVRTYPHCFVLLLTRKCVHMTSSAIVDTANCASSKHNMSTQCGHHPPVVCSESFNDTGSYVNSQDSGNERKRDER